jgi:hypothetical protein
MVIVVVVVVAVAVAVAVVVVVVMMMMMMIYLSCYIHQVPKLQILAFPISKKFQETAIAHVFLHNVNRFLLGADCEQCYQTVMPELLHD